MFTFCILSLIVLLLKEAGFDSLSDGTMIVITLCLVGDIIAFKPKK